MPNKENDNNLPHLAQILLRLWVNPALEEEIEGNLIEFRQQLREANRSQRYFWWQVVSYLRWTTRKELKINSRYIMFSFNPRLTIRNLVNNGFTTSINIGGFLLGLVSVFYLYFYIQSELTYDDFHADSEEIYRLLRIGEMKGEPYNIGVTSGPYAEALRTDFSSDVNATTRALPSDGLVTSGSNSFYEDNVLLVDANFFNFFSYPLLTGDKETVLQDPSSCVLSAAMAKKYFGDEDPIGKEIQFNKRFDYVVTGVMDELPSKSHLNFDVVLSIAPLNTFAWFNDWWSNGLITYVNIDSPAKAEKLKSQLNTFMMKYFGEDFKASGNKIGLTLEPLNEIYFNSDTQYDRVRHGNLGSVITLIAVAISILIIACFNYMNLSLAQSFTRAKEVGIRKLIGGGTRRLTLQFLSEVTLILVFTILLSVGVLQLMLPLLNSYFDLAVELNWLDPNVLGFIATLFITTLILSGLYPTWQMASMNPLKTLKGMVATNSNKLLKKGLVTVQYMISAFMVSATILVTAQLSFVNKKSLGFDEKALLTIDVNNSEIRDNLDALRTHLQANPHVASITNVSGEPGGFHDTSSFDIQDVEENRRFRTLFTDHNYLETMGMTTGYGSNFRELDSLDANAGMMLNEAAVRDLGVEAEDLLGRTIKMPGWDIERVITGIVKDYHFQSLHTRVEPLAIIQGGRPRRMMVKLNTTDLAGDIEKINQAWAEVSPSFPITLDFLDDSLARLYADEKKQSHVFNVFSAISILLACLGVLALTSYTTKKRQAEFGIRKVLGAPISNIMRLISTEFMVIIVISSLLAIPFTYLFMNDWLTGFAYRIDLVAYWPVYILSGLVLGAITWLTVGIMTYRSAILNPLETINRD